MSFMKKWQKKVQFSQIKMTQHIFTPKKRLSMAAIFLLSTWVFLDSCKKVESDMGIETLPDSDLLGVEVDTFEVNAYSVREDSLKSDEFSVNLIGSINQQVFGKTKCSFYTQIRLSAFNPNFDVANTIVDSVVFSLNIDGHYGNSDPQTFKVYQLTDDIYRDSSYYTNTVKANNGINLVKPGFETFTPSVYGNPVVDGDTLEPQIRIRLDETFGDMIINNQNYLGNDDSFNLLIKGLYVTVDQTSLEGGIYKLDMEHSETKVTIYYHDLTDTTKYELPVNDKCARFTVFEHDYSSSPQISQQLIDSLGDEFYYIEAGAGLVANLSFPGLMNLINDGPVIINKAELYLPAQHYSIDPFTPPGSMLVYGLDDEGEIYTLPDYSLGTSIYGGVYDEAKKAYKFNILRYIQQVLKGDVSNNELRLVSTASVVSVNRVVMSGKNSPHRDKPYLKIYYTKYE